MTSRIFSNEALKRYVTEPNTIEARYELPAFARGIALDLVSLVERVEFHAKSIDCDGPSESHRCEPRSEEEIDLLLRSVCHGLQILESYGFTFFGTDIEALADDTSDDCDHSPCEGALSQIETWPQTMSRDSTVSPEDLSPYLTSADAGLDGFEALQATLSNVAAAVGLLKLDRAISCWENKKYDDALIHLARSAQFLASAVKSEMADSLNFFDRAHRRNVAQERARKRHETSVAAIGKENVHEWWVRWQGEPAMYQSIAQFARAMLDKYPDHLTSEAVIARWVRGWSKAR